MYVTDGSLVRLMKIARALETRACISELAAWNMRDLTPERSPTHSPHSRWTMSVAPALALILRCCVLPIVYLFPTRVY